MQVIAVQLDTVARDREANHEQVEALLGQVAVAPGALVVLPEMFATGYSRRVDAVAEGESRPSEAFMARLARALRAYVQGGVVARAAGGRGLNQAVTFGPGGRERARYSKMHPFSFGGEDRHYAPGGAVSTFDWEGVPVGSTVCYDLRFPELYRAGARLGVEVYTCIANWPEAREAHWLALLRARAIENQAYVVGVNRRGSDARLRYRGRSQVIDPQGRVLADAGSEARAMAVDLDREALWAYRRELPFLADIRPDLVPDG